MPLLRLKMTLVTALGSAVHYSTGKISRRITNGRTNREILELHLCTCKLYYQRYRME